MSFTDLPLRGILFSNLTDLPDFIDDFEFDIAQNENAFEVAAVEIYDELSNLPITHNPQQILINLQFLFMSSYLLDPDI